MKLLVTGGAGFIGSNFVNKTLTTSTDLEITVIDSLTYAGRASNLNLLDSRLRLIQGDVRNSSLVDDLVSTSDLVIHFAAETHNDNALRDPLPFVQTNIIATYNLIQSCVKHDVRFHHISTDEVFGDLPLTESAKFNLESPYKPSSPYSSTKAASDLLVKAWIKSYGLRATISNCSNNYGPNQHEEKLIPRSILLAVSGVKPKIYGDGLNVRDWIHVEDHNEGVWAVIEKGKIGASYLLGSNQERSNLQVVRAILRELDLPEDFIEFVEDRPGHDLRYAIDASKAREELGWEPKYKSFEEGLKPVVAHYAELARTGKIDISRISSSGPSISI